MDKERFSLLLLEPGETYFEDFSVYCFKPNPKEPEWDQKKTLGRLKMCSKSIVFDPRDAAMPLIKIPLKDCVRIGEWKQPLMLSVGSPHVLSIECKQYVHMLTGNVIAPYTFIAEKQEFVFSLNYVSLHDVLVPLGQLHRASSLPAAEQNSMIATIIYSRQKRVSFDHSWLEDFSERTVVELAASKILPLVNNPGRVLLSNMRLYFQPFNNVEKTPVLKIQLKDVRQITKRRFLLRHLGLEISCVAGSPLPHIYLALDSPEERDMLYQALVAQELNLEESRQAELTLQWQNGVISNYEYLLYLNSQADRSFSDLTQYPVFPWVVADMTSPVLDLSKQESYRDVAKPVGALNPTRLERLLDRYEEMDPPKFLYGSHYSAPGLVLFYLVRNLPHLMLCLQNGRFDHPDRMFNSMKDVWKNVNTSMADFKELIPEFYDTEKGGEFCINKFGINFGYRHDGAKVGDVELPPWAQGCPQTFVQKLREALESDYVSQNIHHWIDLIFGYKQVGVEAEKAHNVFYPMCYEGKVDLTAERDFSKRHALEVQIMEFGQIPRQLFLHPHPTRVILAPEFPLSVDMQHSLVKKLSPALSTRHLALEKVQSLRAHRETVSCLAIEASKVFSVGHDGVLKVYSGEHKEVLRSANLSSLALSCCTVLPGGSTVLAGSWDNHIFSYQVEFGRSLQLMQAHEDAVTCLAWRPSLLASGSWDCSVRLWRVVEDSLGRQPIRATSAFLAELEHNDRISCLDLGKSSLVTGTEEGELQLWDVEKHCCTQQLEGHKGKIVGAKFSPDGRKLISCGEDAKFKVLDLNSGMLVYSKDVAVALTSMCWDGSTLLLGGVDGSLLLWDLIQVREVAVIKAHQGAVTAIAMSCNGKLVTTGGADKTVAFWESQL